MATYLKTFDQALMDMARHLRADLGMDIDLIEGSVTRSLLEAVAFQVADLSERQERSILESIPEAVFSAFGFARLPAQPARGLLVFSAPVPVNDVVYIPAGAEAISDDDQIFVTIADAYLTAGQTYVTIPAQAKEGGAAGNIQALSITRLGFGLPGVSSVSNPQPFAGGQDAETVDAQRSRFLSWLSGLDQSDLTGLRSQLLQVTGPDAGGGLVSLTDALIADADTDEDIYPGTFQVHIYRLGGIPAGLLAAVKKRLGQVRAGGCIPKLIITNPRLVDVNIHVNGSAYAVPRVQAAVDAYFLGLGYGQKLSYENLITVATNADPSITEVKVLSPTDDVIVGPYEHLAAGVIGVALGDA